MSKIIEIHARVTEFCSGNEMQTSGRGTDGHPRRRHYPPPPLRRVGDKKASLYSKAKRTNKADLWAKYKLCKRHTQRAIRSARWSFLKNKLSESLEQKNSKPLWRYIKSKRQDGNGLSFEGKRPAAFR